jgi:uncharacterized protein (TIGR03083 family)
MTDGTPFDDEAAALLALDALQPGEQADEEVRADMLPGDLAAAAALLAEGSVMDPPPGLWPDTLAHAISRRRPGRPLDAVQPCDPAIAFDRTVADLDHLLRSLTDAEWMAPAHAAHGTVRDLIAHLVGVERLVLRWLDPDDAVPDFPDHITATRPVIAELADADPRDVARQWYDTARTAAGAVAGDRSRMVVFHDITVSVDQLLVMRTGELWAHAIDVCRAVGRSLPQLDMERMATLSTEVMAAVPLAMAYRGSAAPGRAARFVLTGPAGGVYVVPLAPQAEAAEPEVTIVTDPAGLCQVAVRRLTPEGLDAAIDGDQALGGLVLAGIGALARD